METNDAIVIPDESPESPGGVTVDTDAIGNENGQPEVMDLTAESSPPPPVEVVSIPGLSLVSPLPIEPPSIEDVQPLTVQADTTIEGKNTSQMEDESSEESDDDDDSEMLDDSGITLNLQQDDADDVKVEREFITVDSSSDEEIEKGRPKKSETAEPFGGDSSAGGAAAENAKPSGAIAVSTGLKLGKAGKSALGVAKLTRRPLADSIREGAVEVIDYSTPESTNPSAGIRSNLPSGQPTGDQNPQVINLVSDQVDIPVEDLQINSSLPATQTKQGTASESDSESDSDSSEDEDEGMIRFIDDDEESEDSSDDEDEGEIEDDDEDEEEGIYSDHDSSVSSIDTEVWKQQQRYYVKHASPPLLHEENRPLLAADMSTSEAVKKMLAKKQAQNLSQKRKICDICMEPHVTDKCDQLKCEICKVNHEHFSFNCPYKSSAYKSDLPICNVPLGQKDFEIWRIMPKRLHPPVHKSAKIPMSCYKCGDDNHFGDDCPSHGKNRADASTTSIWNARAASQWTTMNMDSKYIKNSRKQSKDIIVIDDEEPSWFDAKLKAAKEKVPDANLAKEFAEELRNRPPPPPPPQNRNQFDKGPRNNHRSIQINAPSRVPGNNYGGGGGPSFTNFQPSSHSGSFASRVGPRADDAFHPRHELPPRPAPRGRDRSYSPPPHNGGGRQGGYGRDQRDYRDRNYDRYDPPPPQPPPPQMHNRGPPGRGHQGYHAVPPPQDYHSVPPPQSSGHAGGGWRLPQSVAESAPYNVLSSSQPPLPSAPAGGQNYPRGSGNPRDEQSNQKNWNRGGRRRKFGKGNK